MDRSQFGQIVQEHKDRIHTYAVWMLRDFDEARDIAQESLTRLWQHRGEIHNGAARTWLMRTTHRLCVDRLRRRATRAEVPLENLIRPPADAEPGPPAVAERDEARTVVLDALAKLSPRDRAVVLMREYDGMSYEEMADALGMPLSALKTTLYRARRRLKEALNGTGVTP
jgi:RNA polymerase sigma-70 factor (ECF subfamily)